MACSGVNRDWFYKLASDLEDERVSAAVSLIKELAALKLPEDAEEWSYVLKRLVNGLSSNRNSARLGFSLCLTEVVNVALAIEEEEKRPKELVTIDKFFDLLSNTLSLNNTDSKKHIKGKDERGLLFGKMFGLQALLNEPVFSQIFIANDTVTLFAVKFMEELMQLAVRKTWLKEPCLFTLFRTIGKLLPFLDVKTIKTILILLDQYDLTLTNEGLAIYLFLFQNVPVQTSSVASALTLNSKSWKSNDPLARGNLPLLSQVLRNSVMSQDVEDLASKQGSNWNPRLHFVWDVLLPIITDCEQAVNRVGANHDKPQLKKRKKESGSVIEFPEFWKVAVDESFFNDKSSSERKYLGFLIFDKIIELVPSDWLHLCFSPNLMRSLINQSSDSKRSLFKMSQKSLQNIITICEKNPAERLTPCIEAMLFGPHGSINFDKLTKSKTASKLIALNNLRGKALSHLIERLAARLTPEKQKSEIQFSLDTILHAVRSHKFEITSEISLKPLFHSIILLAFFLKENEEVNKLARERLYSILSELTSLPSDGHSWQFQAVETIAEIQGTGMELVNPLDEGLSEIKDNCMSVLGEISVDLNRPQARGLECLLSTCVLGIFCGETESVSISDELCSFHNEMKNSSASLVGLTEILLSLLAQKKSLFRKLSLLVWQQYIDIVGESELRVLINVLKARENKKGFSELFEGADEAETDDELREGDNDEVADDESFDEDEEVAVDEIEDGTRSEEMTSGDESDDSSDPDDGADDDIAKIDKEATSALAKALNIPENIVNDKGEVDFNKLGKDSGDDSDENDDEMESMDDEMMMQLDGQLSEIFKRRKEALTNVSTGNDRKVEAKESREDVIAFKHRIIDMLEIYVKDVERKVESGKVDSPCLHNLLLLIEPSINCIRETVDKSLALKLSKLLRTRVYKIKVSAFCQTIQDPSRFYKLLEFTLEKLLVLKPGLHQVVYFSFCSTTSLFLAKILIGNSGKEVDNVSAKIIDLYANTMKLWVSRGKCGPNVFIDLVNWLNSRKHTA